MSDTTTSRQYSWLWLLISMLLIVTLTITGIALHHLETRMVAATGESLSLAALGIAEKLDALTLERYMDVQMLVRARTFQEHDTAAMVNYLEWMTSASPVYEWLSVTDATGRIVASTDLDSIGKDRSGSQWFQEVRDRGVAQIDNAQRSEDSHGLIALAFTAAIKGPRNEFLGVVTSRVSVLTMEDILMHHVASLQEQWGTAMRIEYQLINRRGDVIADSQLREEGRINLKEMGLPSARLLGAFRHGFVKEQHLRRQVEVVTGYATTKGIEGYPALEWGVLVRVDQHDVLVPIREFLLKLGLVGAAVTVPTLGLLVWITKRVQREHLLAQQGNMLAKEVEVSLRKSEAHTKRIVETALDAFIGMDAAGIITDWNIQAEQMFGWPQREAIGRSLSTTIIPAQDREAYDRALQQFLATGEGQLFSKRIEISGWHREGREFPVELSITPILSNGRYTFNGFVRDLTSRKLAEAGQMRLLTVLNASLNEIFMFRTDTLRFTYVNRGALDNLGYTLEAIQALTPIDIKPEMTEASFRELVSPLLTGEQRQLIFQTVHLRKNGSHYPVEVHLQVVEQDKEITFLALIHDVTAQRQQECRQAAEHAVTRLLLESNTLEEVAPAIMKIVCRTLDWDVGVLWRVDEEMQVLRCVDVWSDQRVDFTPFIEGTRGSNFARGIGLPGRVWESRKVEWLPDILCDDNFPRAPFARLVGLHAAFAFAITIDNEVYGVMEFFATTIREPDQNVLDMFHDLAGKLSQFLSRKHAEQRLQQAKDRAELAAREKAQILAAVEAFFIGVTEQGVVSEWTSRAEQIFAIPLSDAIGRFLRDLPIAWVWDEILAALGKSGDTVMTVRIERIRLTVAGMKEKFVNLTISPICEDRGIGYVIMGEDVTDRLRLEDELVQAQKLESIGHLAAGIAHEINTPTQFVGDNVRFLSDSFTDINRLIEQYQRLLAAAKTGVCPEALIETCEAANRGADLEYLLAEIPKAIAQTVEGVDRVATIVRAMKEFSHPGSKEKASVNLNRAIESTVTVARNEWKYVADLQTNLDPSLPLVPCLVGEFNQVVLNMIVNATHAIADAVKGTGGKGTITICTSRVGDFVEVRIADTGLGIPESVRHKIFDPFFTTKEVGRGTGQGLAIARSVVVDKHGGTIDVESEVGKGTTFLIRLPLIAPSSESVKEGA